MRLVLDRDRSMLSRLTADLGPWALLNHITEAVAALLDCDPRASSSSTSRHRLAVDEGGAGPQRRRDRIPAGAGIVGAAFQANQLLHVPAPMTTRASTRQRPQDRVRHAQPLLGPDVDLHAQPVASSRRSTSARRRRRLLRQRQAMLQLLAEQAGVAIQRFTSSRRVESMALRKELDPGQKVQRR
jgi:hypothetical protein